MNILLWILQVLLALHTAMGAVWKFSNSAQAVPPLKDLPQGAWLALAVMELACSLALVLPVKKPLPLAAIAAGFIALEMLAFCGFYALSGATDTHFVAYWLVVGILAGFVAWGRRVPKSL